ncbi:MAG: glutamine--tRNA ligase, partial [Clostridia bacterium]|nr:glutamine--tRNA ligase [Clostridia bacterium]
TYDPETKGGNTPDGRKVKGTIHWVDAATAKDAEVRLYSSLFLDAEPEAGDQDFLEVLNPDSLEKLTACKIEAGILPAEAPAAFQFLRLGYFCIDNVDSTAEHPVFNRSVSLKDGFNKK